MSIGNGSGLTWNDAGDGDLSGGINVNNGFIDSNGELKYNNGDHEVKKYYNLLNASIYYKHIIPPGPMFNKHTSFTSDSGTISASDTDAGGVGYAWKAVDQTDVPIITPYSYWHSTATGPHWLQYALTSASTASEYSIKAALFTTSGFPRAPASWTLQGSNNGVDWTDIDTRSGVNDWSALETKSFTVTTPGKYSWYRLNNIIAIQSSFIHIEEWQMIGS